MPKFLSEEWASEVKTALDSSDAVKSAAGNMTAKIQQVVTGAPDGEVKYWFQLEGGTVDLGLGDIEGPDATITQDYDTAKGISTGELSAVAAYMSGKLRVQGNLMKLMTMQGVLTQLPNALKGLEVDY